MTAALLIDDDPLQHKLMQQLLLAAGREDFDLSYAATVDEAADALGHRRFDVIFLDNRLAPHRDYRETAPKIRPLAPDAALCVISASVDEEVFSQSRDFGVDRVIDKVALINELTASA